MSDERSRDGRFEIISHTRDDDSYFYSDTDYSWYVRSLETGDEIASFSGRWYQRRDGDTREGVKSVGFSEMGDAVVATRFDGTSERVELPARISIIDGGRAVELTWRDGRKESRDRREVSMFSKYGEPFGPPLIGAPKSKPEPPPWAAQPASSRSTSRPAKEARKAAAKRPKKPGGKLPKRRTAKSVRKPAAGGSKSRTAGASKKPPTKRRRGGA